MGTEQSTQRDRVVREGLTQRAVERVLEQQRRIYEQRCSEILQSQTNATTAATTVRQSEIRTQANQRYDVNTASRPAGSASQAPRFSSPVEESITAPLRPPPPAARNVTYPSLNNNGLQRERNPYSFTRDNLQNPRQSAGTIDHLYPNLNNNQNSTPRNNNPFTLPNASSASSASNSRGNAQRPDDFVFVNNREPERFVPSAPPPPQSRSVSRSRSRRSDDDVSCPTCSNSFGLTIFQCNNGHSSCRECKMRSASCGICRQTITDMRNITLESYIAERKIECANARDGCSLFIKLADMEIHLKECPFKEMQCPLPSNLGVCQWRGKLSQMASHFDAVHPMQTQGDVDTELFLLNICDDSEILYYIVIGSYNFLFHLKVSAAERKVYMAVQLIGTKVSASKWNYEIHVYNKRQPRRKYQYNDSCRSASEPIGDIFRESSCAVIPLSYAMSFVNEGALTYKFYIKKEEAYQSIQDPNSNYRGRGWGRGRGRGRGARNP